MSPLIERSSRIFLCADPSLAERIAGTLINVLAVGPERIAGVINLPSGDRTERADVAAPDFQPHPVIELARAATGLTPSDEIIVAGEGRDECIAHLLAAGFVNIFDGDALLRRFLPDQPLSVLVPELHIGPVTSYDLNLADMESMRFRPTPFSANSFPGHGLFLVNSIPKSGTIWMAALLESVFQIKARQQIIISHGADIENDWKKPNLVGAVAMARDMRDVVVSWYHHLARSDVISGYASPRYPTIERFYREFFLATLTASPRYYRGSFERWFNVVASHYVPIVRYEDLWEDAEGALERILVAWQISFEPQRLKDAAAGCGFEAMRGRPRISGDYISDMLQRGHLRRGVPGAWRDELPAEIAEDVAHRFADYQSRLGY